MNGQYCNRRMWLLGRTVNLAHLVDCGAKFEARYSGTQQEKFPGIGCASYFLRFGEAIRCESGNSDVSGKLSATSADPSWPSLESSKCGNFGISILLEAPWALAAAVLKTASYVIAHRRRKVSFPLAQCPNCVSTAATTCFSAGKYRLWMHGARREFPNPLDRIDATPGAVLLKVHFIGQPRGSTSSLSISACSLFYAPSAVRDRPGRSRTWFAQSKTQPPEQPLALSHAVELAAVDVAAVEMVRDWLSQAETMRGTRTATVHD